MNIPSPSKEIRKKCQSQTRTGEHERLELFSSHRIRVWDAVVTATDSKLMHSQSMSRSSRLIALITLCLGSVAHATNSFQERCLSFTPEAYIYNSSRHLLAYVAAGTNLTLPDNDATCAQPSQVVAVNLCRVGLSIPTSNRSSISFELWLPEDYSDRFLVTGNGGIDGCGFSPRYCRAQCSK